MTLGDFFNYCSEHHTVMLLYFLGIPFLALLFLIFGKGEGHLSPWKQMYSFLVFACCLPGIFAATLGAYNFLFERSGILQANVFIYFLPIISMLVTLWLIRKNVSFDAIPGFDKIGGLIFFLFVLIIFMFIFEKMNFIIFTHMSILQFILLLVGFIFLLRLGIKRFISS